MPCAPVSFPSPTVSHAPQVPGFGTPFVFNASGPLFPSGFPEDILDLFNKFQFLIPSGTFKPSLFPNFSKDIFDAILSLLDQFMPFLMIYKFFLPLLNLIICIIEVLCALMNPFALISALHRLFNVCIPAFLSLFPIFALILMIISLLLLLLALIEYIIAQILKFVAAILRNINALVLAFQQANATSVLAIANKLASLLCIFQNLFVLLAIFGVIIGVIQDILKMSFAIPPCEGGGPGSTEGCCSATVCPTIVQNQYTNKTGVLQYLNEVGYKTNISLGANFLTSDLRTESWQLYDPDQTIAQAFWNIVDGYDISPTVKPTPIFFPTDSSYSATTSPQQAAYTVDLRLFYNPVQWNRSGKPQFIQFKDCIVLFAPTQNLEIYNNTDTPVPTGVFFLAGGSGFLDDGVTELPGYQSDGYHEISPFTQATLENFLHQPAEFSASPVLQPTDGYKFSNMQYTFKPNLPVLLQKNLITLGCEPDIALSRAFVNNVMFSGIATQTAALTNLIFPDPAGAQECLLAAVSALQTNMTVEGVANFQSTTTICLNKLRSDTTAALGMAIGIGFSPCNSNFTLTPNVQFTTQTIVVTVNLNENNGLPITQGIPIGVADALAAQIIGYPTFGTLSTFSYDGYQAFTANITSNIMGSGSLMVAFQNQVLCVNTLPTDGYAPSHTLQSLDYQFIFAPSGAGSHIEPRRDAGDLARDNSSNRGA